MKTLKKSHESDTMSNRIVHISVQLFSNEELARQVTEECQLLDIMVTVLLYMMESCLIKSELQGGLNLVFQLCAGIEAVVIPLCSCTTNSNFKAASQVNPQNVLTHWYLYVVICNTEISFAQNSPLPCWGKLVISSLKLECNCSLEPKFWFRILNEHVELEFMGNVLFRTIDWKQLLVFNHETASDFLIFLVNKIKPNNNPSCLPTWIPSTTVANT